MDTPGRVLRIFLSSTAVDLKSHRDKTEEAILRLEHLPIGMRAFTALPGTPAAECCAKAAAADAVVVLVAHRYGYVPPRELGGDGKRSITWLEVAAAREAGKPVFAFLVDRHAPWVLPKEQDRLLTEPDRAQDIFNAVQGLVEFRKYLEANFTCSSFTNEEHLATLVTATLAMALAPRPAVWNPRLCHGLHPARHFHGREALRKELLDWVRAPRPAARVISLIAGREAGKTALVAQLLADLAGRVPAGLLVWSFRADPRPEEFLRAACDYFDLDNDGTAHGRLECLQQFLAGETAHLLVFDSLERVQTQGDDGAPPGSIGNVELKRLLLGLASGSGRARALVTTCCPLVDLQALNGAGHREERLDPLGAAEARAMLRAWGVRGDDATLDRLTVLLSGRAMSVDVLGAYLSHFCDGDPSVAGKLPGLFVTELGPAGALPGTGE
jgi:hypothetical protein